MRGVMNPPTTKRRLLAEFARRSGDPHPMQYDHVIRCLGWKHNKTMYSPDTTPLMQHTAKYPYMTSEYESTNVAGMYFAGQLGR